MKRNSYHFLLLIVLTWLAAACQSRSDEVGATPVTPGASSTQERASAPATPTARVPSATLIPSATVPVSLTVAPLNTSVPTPTATTLPSTETVIAAPVVEATLPPLPPLADSPSQLLVAIRNPETGIDDLYVTGLDGTMTLWASLADLAGSYSYIASATAVGDLLYLGLVETGLFSYWTFSRDGEFQSLDFISAEDRSVHEIAIWPGTADQPPRLAWATNQNGLAQLHTSAADGSEQIVLGNLIQDINDGVWYSWRVLRWSANGQRLYFSAEPAGMGGLFLFGGYSDLWVYDLAANTTTQLVDAFTCLEPLSPDEQWLVDHCNDSLSLTNLATAKQRTLVFPAAVENPGQFGGVRFRPDNSRFAYGIESGVANRSFINDPETVHGWVVIVDTVTGNSSLVTTSPPHSYFTVQAWLPPDVLVLQAYEMPGYLPSVWVVNADGTGLVKLTDGQILTWMHEE